jgi:hypothetical protein
MFRVAVLLFASAIAACAAEARHRPGEESDRSPSTKSSAGEGAFDPSLDTPREMPEEAGSGNVEPPPARPQASDAHGMGGGQETDAAAAVRCPSLALVADDGTFLGVASSTARAADSVCNARGDYGGSQGAYSIFNPTSPYGNTTSQTSAFNASASRPPRLFCESTEVLLNPVTKNVFLPGAIDPDALCTTLAGSGY